MSGILAALATGASVKVALTTRVITKSGVGSVTSGYQIANDGTAQKADGTFLENWLSAGGNVANFQVRATLQSGALATGTTGSWLACSSTQTWTVVASGGGGAQAQAVILVEIRDAASPNTVRASATITINAISN